MSRCWQFLLGAWAMACSLARDVRAHLVGMHAVPQTTTAPGARANDGSEQPKRLCGDAPALSPDRSNKHNHDRRRGWSSSRWLVWTAARKRRISSRHPATRLSSSGSLPSVLTQHFADAELNGHKSI